VPRVLVDESVLERLATEWEEHWEAVGFFDAMLENIKDAAFAGRPRYRRDWS
jgi:hypothetical protein